MVNEYNKFMNAVDKADTASNRIPYQHRNRKWTTAAFIAELQICLANSWIFWNDAHSSEANSQTHFMENLMVQLARKHRQKEKKHEYSGIGSPGKVKQKSKCCVCNVRTEGYCINCSVAVHEKCFQKHCK
jgi:hypothetical protein